MKFLKRALSIVQKYPVVTVVLAVVLVFTAILFYTTRQFGPIIISPKAQIEHDKAQQDKGAADELRRQITELEKEFKAEQDKTARLEQELKDAKAATAAAKKAYDGSRVAPPRNTPVNGSTTTDSICARAERLGVPC